MTFRLIRSHGLVLAAALALAACAEMAPPPAATATLGPPAATAPLGPAVMPGPAADRVAGAQSGDTAGKALAAYQAGAYDQAVAAAAVAAATTPGERAGAMLFGRSLLAADRGAEAEQVFHGVLANHGTDLGALNGLGVAQALQGKFGAAVATLSRARDQAPADPAIANNLALALFLDGHQGEALAMLDAVMARPAKPASVAVLKAVLAAVATGTGAGQPVVPDPLLRRVIAMRQK